MKKYILLLSFAMIISGLAHGADDPMKSLFVFQQKMANRGNSSAMMKLGEMYEQGVGVKQDFDQAILMYRKAKSAGHAGADAAIARVNKTRRELSDKAKQEKEHAAREKRRQQAKKRAEAKRQAEMERQARIKARQEALARQRAERKRQEAIAREKAARAQAAMEAQRLARQQAEQEKEQARLQQASVDKQQTKKDQDTKKSSERFRSDPCKGPAARLMSICK